MNRRKISAITAYVLSALLFWGCVSSDVPTETPSHSPIVSEATPSPTPGVDLTPSPTPELTPAPTPTPSPSPAPSPTPIVYDIADFLPTEDLHIRYESSLSGGYIETYVEYTDENESGRAVQHRVISTSRRSPEVRVTRCENGRIFVAYEKSGVGYTYRFLDHSSNIEDILLMEPVEVGTSWPVDGGVRTITAVDHIIDLSIGSYRAVEVTTSFDSSRKTLQYYVPAIGLVAEYTLENGAYTDAYEATLLSSDQGFSQLIRFYYAQPLTDTVRYESRSVNIKPNSSMGSRFVNQFRRVPSGKGLLALDGLSIRSIRLDSKGYVHVDFSSSLTRIVSSVGRATESLILIALTNTFCDYYQSDRLYITVAGELYESPYRFFMEGDYLSPDDSRVKALD
ncbi:MAG: GerMN domain-containing protein [Christensenellales bacterium]